jgi:hypothetical protein
MTDIAPNIFRAHMTFKMVGIDSTLKRIATQCVQHEEIRKPADLFARMKNHYEGEFWCSVPGTSKILETWIKWVAGVLTCPLPPLDISQLRNEIWLNFVNRLGLEPALICSTTGKPDNPHGHVLLQLFLQVVEETIYFQFSLDCVPITTTPEPSSPVHSFHPYGNFEDYVPRETFTAPTYSENNPQFESSYTQGQSVENESNTEEQGKIQSRVFLPKNDRNGLQVKLHRSNRDKTRNKARKNIQSDSSDGDY